MCHLMSKITHAYEVRWLWKREMPAGLEHQGRVTINRIEQGIQLTYKFEKSRSSSVSSSESESALFGVWLEACKDRKQN